MAKVGRPPKIPEHDMPELVEKFRRYIEETDLPIIAEFAYQNDLTKQYMGERVEFSDLVKKCLQKKEAALERGMLTNAYNSTGAIFSLKQIGWRDKQDIEHSGGMNNTVTVEGLTVQELKDLAKTKRVAITGD